MKTALKWIGIILGALMLLIVLAVTGLAIYRRTGRLDGG